MDALHALRQLVRSADAVTILLHYSDRHGHAQHLLWSCVSAEAEIILKSFECGGGPGLNGAMHDRGITFELVNCWAGGAATREAIRAAHNNRRFCYRCCYGRVKQLPLFRNVTTRSARHRAEPPTRSVYYGATAA